MPAPVFRAGDFAELPPERRELFQNMLTRSAPAGAASYFPGLVGLVTEEVRTDYARMRLPFRPVLNQPAGVVHGGAIATLIDTVIVPAVASGYDAIPLMLTLHLGINFLAALREEDAVAEGWVLRRGFRTLFCEARVFGADSGDIAATGELVYSVKHPTASPHPPA